MMCFLFCFPPGTCTNEFDQYLNGGDTSSLQRTSTITHVFSILTNQTKKIRTKFTRFELSLHNNSHFCLPIHAQKNDTFFSKKLPPKFHVYLVCTTGGGQFQVS